MSTGLIIALSITVVFIGMIIINYRKMKNMPDVKSSAKIKNLNAKNFKTQTKSEELQELLIFITPRIVQLEQRDKLKRFSTGAP